MEIVWLGWGFLLDWRVILPLVLGVFTEIFIGKRMDYDISEIYGKPEISDDISDYCEQKERSINLTF